ncbi:hypothetical protein PVAP13_7KG183455 [Panicum virgatum]|uniref:Uncharacterized protein n=1 Tax=Panicum virgatum TaxID=38727 RepID=A0A8T0QNA1_PANVG|nr:hypothetical protein PVAP13_7KG183455 [Panicum virgatum]
MKQDSRRREQWRWLTRRTAESTTGRRRPPAWKAATPTGANAACHLRRRRARMPRGGAAGPWQGGAKTRRGGAAGADARQGGAEARRGRSIWAAPAQEMREREREREIWKQTRTRGDGWRE